MESEMKFNLILTIIAVFVQFIECFRNNLAVLFELRWRRKCDCIILEEIECFIIWMFYTGGRIYSLLLLLQFHKTIGFDIIGSNYLLKSLRKLFNFVGRSFILC
jgi:hypothetical protein